mmetsp:Transcript_42833/g.71239  ORF Transcript_42833/g.71239 Transcript_42833/m.71239 type:complete len:95 (-) Transcript_42833:338-622(-)
MNNAERAIGLIEQIRSHLHREKVAGSADASGGGADEVALEEVYRHDDGCERAESALADAEQAMGSVSTSGVIALTALLVYCGGSNGRAPMPPKS